MTTETLLPCPWCGGDVNPASVTEGTTFRWRKVDGCCADGPEIRHDTMAADPKAAEARSRAKAIAAWNTRAPPDAGLLAGESCMDRLARQQDIVTRTAGKRPTLLLIGRTDFAELLAETGSMKMVMAEDSIGGGRYFSGMKVLMIPWMRGTLVLPEGAFDESILPPDEPANHGKQ